MHMRKNLILFGPPGAGKGTFSGQILKILPDIVHISTGDLFRYNLKNKTQIGLKAKEYMDKGALVPDEVVIEMVRDKLNTEEVKSNGYILDGFPRTMYQAEALKDILSRLGMSLDAVVNLEVPEDVIIRRLTSRRTCSNTECHAIYNIYTMPSKREGICDKCGSPIVQRDDETEEIIKKRLETYHEQTAPLIEYYRDDSIFLSVPALDAHEVYKEIVKVIP